MLSPSHVKQVGGDHYNKGTHQHWDIMDRGNVSYLEACATKYIFRWREKGGIQDLEKAKSYIKKRICAVEEADPLYLPGRRFSVDAIGLTDWFSECNVSRLECTIITLVLNWRDKNDLNRALHLIDGLIEVYNEDKDD